MIRHLSPARASCCLGVALLVVSTSGAAPAGPTASSYDDVDPFIGTGGEGHTYPGATVPFGMVQLSPETDVRHFKQSFPWAAGYRHSDKTILGFAHTHFSGTGHSDLGDVLMMPTVGPAQLDPGNGRGPRRRLSLALLPRAGERAARLLLGGAAGHRHQGRADRHQPGGRPPLHLPAERSGARGARPGEQHLQLRRQGPAGRRSAWTAPRLVTGFRHTKGWAPNRKLYFALEFSKPFTSYGLANEHEEEYRGFGRTGEAAGELPGGRRAEAEGVFQLQDRAGRGRSRPRSPSRRWASTAPSRTCAPRCRAGTSTACARPPARPGRGSWASIAWRATASSGRCSTPSLYHTMLAPVTYMDVDGRYRGADDAIHAARGLHQLPHLLAVGHLPRRPPALHHPAARARRRDDPLDARPSRAERAQDAAGVVVRRATRPGA